VPVPLGLIIKHDCLPPSWFIRHHDFANAPNFRIFYPLELNIMDPTLNMLRRKENDKIVE
jgi:hypothetical protein